jgi:hypothetical protein
VRPRSRPARSLLLLAPFERAPLSDVMGRMGFSHEATPEDDAGYRVVFTRA